MKPPEQVIAGAMHVVAQATEINAAQYSAISQVMLGAVKGYRAHLAEDAREALAEWDAATEGDSGDDEIDAANNMADVLRALVG